MIPTVITRCWYILHAASARPFTSLPRNSPSHHPLERPRRPSDIPLGLAQHIPRLLHPRPLSLQPPQHRPANLLRFECETLGVVESTVRGLECLRSGEKSGALGLRRGEGVVVGGVDGVGGVSGEGEESVAV